MNTTCYKLIVFISLALLQSGCYNLCINFRVFVIHWLSKCLVSTATKKLLEKIMEANYKEENCATQKERFNWNNFSCRMSQIVHNGQNTSETTNVDVSELVGD